MRDLAKMDERAGYFRDQAKSLRKMGAKSAIHDPAMRERFCDLAAECDAIAQKIEASLASGLHQ